MRLIAPKRVVGVSPETTAAELSMGSRPTVDAYLESGLAAQ
jgi:hypothetical protein